MTEYNKRLSFSLLPNSTSNLSGELHNLREGLLSRRDSVEIDNDKKLEKWY